MLNKILLCVAAFVCLLSLVSSACVTPEYDFVEVSSTIDNGVFEYQGGEVLTSPIVFNQIYYGDVWTDKSNLMSEITYFINNVGSSDIYAYTASLTDADGNTATTDISYGVDFEFSIDTSLTLSGLSPTGDDVKTIVLKAVATGLGSASDIYGVTFGEDVKNGNGVCNHWCGYHAKVLTDTQKVVFLVYNTNAVVTKCTSMCSTNYDSDGVMINTRTQSASVDMGIDLLWGELISTIANADVGQNNPGWESSTLGDAGQAQQLCAFTYGTEQTTAGEQWNAMVGTHMYHLQGNVDADTQCCVVPDITVATGCVSPQYDFVTVEAGTDNGVFEYQGGTVLTSPVVFNQIFYGEVWTDKANYITELTYFINNLGSSDIYSYTAALTDADGNTATTDISFGVTFEFPIDPTLTLAGLSPTGDDVKTIVLQAVATGLGSASDIYGVTFGEDVKNGNGVCNHWCGYHAKVLTDTQKVIFLVYNSNAVALKCTTMCSTNYDSAGVMINTRTQSASVDMGFDLLWGELISTIANSDVGQNNPGWESSTLGDAGQAQQLCAFTYGTEMTTSSGEEWNAMVGTHMYHLQGNVDASTQCCVVPSTTSVASGTMAMVSPSASASTCGDLIVDAGEECDNASGCCSSTCTRMPNKTVCGTRTSTCWTLPKCKRGMCKASVMKKSKWGATIMCNNGKGTCDATGACITA